MTKPKLKIQKAPKSYKLNPEKLKGASQSILPYLFSGNLYYAEDYEYFDVIKPYLDIPEEPKTLEQITQEFNDKIDELIETTKSKFEYSKESAEKRYKYEFDKIFERFEYAKDKGHFPPKLTFTVGDGLYGNNFITSGSSWEQSFVIKQGKKHDGYYTFGNRKYFKYYMPDKPNAIVRFFMKTCLGFFWVDEKNAE